MKVGLWIVLIVIMAIGWRARAALPDLVLSDRDTWGYLSPALSWMSDRGFHQEAGRTWFYPLLVHACLTTGSIAKIAIVQKFLGWVTGLLLALTWAWWVAFLPVARTGRCIALLLGTLPLILQMTNPQTLYFEMLIRPEAMMPFFVFAQLACLTGYFRYRWQYPRPLASALLGFASIVLAYACFLLKPSWLFGAAATVAPVFVGIFIGGQVRRPVRLATPALALLVVAAATTTPSKLNFIEDEESVTFLPQTLLCVHARWIKDSLQQRLDRMPETDPGKPRLQKVVTVLQAEFLNAEKGDHNYEFLGYDPDYLRYRSPLIAAVWEYSHGSAQELRAFCMNAYKQALIDEPVGMTGKVLTQYLHFLFPKPSIFLKKDMDLRRGSQYALESLPETLTPDYSPDALRLLQEYRQELRDRGPAAPALKAWPPLEFPIKYLAKGALPLEIAFLAALLVVHFQSHLHQLRLAGWGAFFFLCAPAGNAMTVSIVHALDISRYRAGYGEFHLFALTAIVVFCAIVLQRIVAQFPATSALRRRLLRTVHSPTV